MSSVETRSGDLSSLEIGVSTIGVSYDSALFLLPLDLAARGHCSVLEDPVYLYGVHLF